MADPMNSEAFGHWHYLVCTYLALEVDEDEAYHLYAANMYVEEAVEHLKQKYLVGIK